MSANKHSLATVSLGASKGAGGKTLNAIDFTEIKPEPAAF